MNHNIKVNIVYNMAYQLLIMILPFITAPYISRVLGADGIGTYTYTYSIAYYFVLFSMQGLLNYGNRSIAKVRDNFEVMCRTFSEIYTMQICYGIVSIMVFFILIQIMHDTYRIIFYMQALYVVSSIFDVSWFFYGIEKFKMMVIRTGIIKIVTTIAIFAFIQVRNDLWKYALIISLGFLISNVYLFYCLRKNVHFCKPEAKKVISHIKPNMILFIPVIAVSLYRIMDKIMIGLMADMVQTGLYENADRLVTLPLSLIASIGTVMMPKMSNLYANGDEKESEHLIRVAMMMVVALSCGMMFGMAAIADRFVPLYYGNGFVQTVKLVVLLTPVLVVGSIANVVRTQYLIPKDKDIIYIVSVISGACINLLLNYFLIPRFGAFGAVIGTLSAETIVMLVQCISVRRELSFKVYFKDTWEFFISGGCMFFIVHNLTIDNSPILGIALQIITGIIAYAIIAFSLYFMFDKDKIKPIVKIVIK